MKRLFKVSFVVILLFSLFNTACKRIDTTDIGSELIPAVDNINTFDTSFDVFTENFLMPDSSRITRAEDHALGVIDNDEEFGKTKAEIYFGLSPDIYIQHPFPKKDSILVFDSVVLALSFSGIYGDTNAIQKFNVYEISNTAPFPTNYYGYRIDTADLPLKPTLLGSKLVNFTTLNDSVYDRRKTDTVRLVNQLRIPLDKSLAARFRNYDTSNAYGSDSAFTSYFKGLAVKVDEAGSPLKNALAYFNLADTKTKLIFYYRVVNGSITTDTLTSEFYFHNFNYHNINSIRRTPGNNYAWYLNNTGPATDEKIYLQTSPGSYASIKIPGLKNFSNRVIHRAELSLEVLPSIGNDKYAAPEMLALEAFDTANARIITIPYDFSYSSNTPELFGGNLKNGKYVFNVARYVQSVVTKKNADYTLRLSAPFRSNAADISTGTALTPYSATQLTGFQYNAKIAYGRVVLPGGIYPNSTKKLKLHIIYSKL